MQKNYNPAENTPARLIIRESYMSILLMMGTWWLVSYFFVQTEEHVVLATWFYQTLVYPACCAFFPYAFSRLGLSMWISVLPPLLIYAAGIFINLPATVWYLLAIMLPAALIGGYLGQQKFRKDRDEKEQQEKNRKRRKKNREE